MNAKSTQIHPRAAFAHRNFRLFVGARFPALCAHQMMIIALSQAVYEVTHSPLHLGYIGLTLFIPKISFTLFAGHAADRFDRRLVMLICRSTQAFLTLALVVQAANNFHPLWLLYVLLFLIGTAYAFDGPASQAVVTQIVPQDHFHNAVTWNSAFFQAAFITGPMLGGWFYAIFHGAMPVLVIVAGMRFFSALLISRMSPQKDHIDASEFSWQTLVAGLRYVFQNRIILGALSMDLFAVLLGGATALLPIFANDILKVGAWGLGLLRTSQALGAAVVGLALAYLPPMKNAGRKMFVCVALFGAGTVAFGLSRNFALSMICLALLGAADMVSVVIRQVLVQVKTPPAMRGRVSAVNLVFIGASNELGEFESGLTASWFGTVPAVVLGGLGTLAVVSLFAWRFPELRNYSSLKEPD